MLPGSYEFSLDPYRLVFVTFFLGVVATLVLLIARALWQSLRDVRAHRAGALRWHEDFAELPERRRSCRHSFGSGGQPTLCENEFACARCERHLAAATEEEASGPLDVHGLEILPDRAYHRGHTWVREEEDGTVTVGLDPLALRTLPAHAVFDLPTPGTRLGKEDASFVLADAGVRVLTPMAGTVVEATVDGSRPHLRMRPDRPVAEHEELLRGREAARWLEAELRQLQARLLGPQAASAWADGGAVVEDLPGAAPRADWRSLREELFLDV